LTEVTEYGDVMINGYTDEWGRRKIDGLLEDGVRIIAVAAAGIPYYATLTEAIGLSDSVVKSASLVRSERIGLSDTYSRVLSLFRSYSEMLGLSDFISKHVAVLRAEEIGLLDAVSTRKSFIMVLTEYFGLSDRMTKAISVTKSDAIGLVDAYSRILSLFRTYTEKLGLSDFVLINDQLVQQRQKVRGWRQWVWWIMFRHLRFYVGREWMLR